MPLYDFECRTCDIKVEVMQKLIDFDIPQLCGICGKAMERRISAVAIHGDLGGYACPITGKYIDGRKAHEENLKRHGCRVLETGESNAVKIASIKAEQELDKSIDRSVDEFITKLPVKKRESLLEGVASGLDVQVSRN